MFCEAGCDVVGPQCASVHSSSFLQALQSISLRLMELCIHLSVIICVKVLSRGNMCNCKQTFWYQEKYMGKVVQCTCVLHEVMTATARIYNIQQRHERQCQQTYVNLLLHS